MYKLSFLRAFDLKHTYLKSKYSLKKGVFFFTLNCLLFKAVSMDVLILQWVLVEH